MLNASPSRPGRPWQEETALLRGLLDSLQDAIGLAEVVPDGGGRPADLRYVEANAAFLRLTGLSADRLSERPFRRIFPGIDPACVTACARVALDGEPAEFECRNPAGDGWLRVRASSPGGGRVTTLITDITEHRSTKEKLRDSEEKLRGLVENALDGVVLTDEGGIVIEWNAAQEQITGLPRSKALGRTFWEVQHDLVAPGPDPPLGLDQREALVRSILSSGRIPEAYRRKESDIRRADGEPRTLQSLAYSIRTERGFRLGALTRDITERRQREEEIRRGAERFRTLAQLAPVGIYLADRSGSCTYVNQRWCEMTGLSPGKALGRGWMKAVHPEDRRQVSSAWREMVESGSRWDHEYRFRRPNGGAAWVKGTATALNDPSGRTAGYIGVNVDITDRRETELTLRGLNEELERKVARRSALAERRARQLQALAVQLIEAEERERNRIAAILHDDLQQLLAAARRKLHWVANPEGSKQSRPAETDAEGLAALLEQAIQKSRSLSHDLSPPVLRYSGLVSAMEWLARQMQEQYGLEVRLEVASLPDEADEAVKVFLFRSVQELLLNVIKHAETLRVQVRARISRGRLQLFVEDEGRGFDPEIMDAADGRLIGVGLFRIRERVRSFGGSLKVESASGRGSCLTLSLPHRRIAPESVGVKRSSRTTGTGAARTGSRTDRTSTAPLYRVLFVDDHQLLRQGLISMLMDQPGIRVIGEAADGREAVDMARELRPDVVVMDIAMPKMDGIEATRRIKEQAPQMRIIGLSMIEDKEVVEAMLQAGAERCVSKTASSGRILQAIYGIDPPD